MIVLRKSGMLLHLHGILQLDASQLSDVLGRLSSGVPACKYRRRTRGKRRRQAALLELCNGSFVMLVLRVDAGNQHIEHVLAVRCVGSKGHGIDKAMKSEWTACTLMQGDNAAYNPVGFSALAAPTPASAARAVVAAAAASGARLKDRYR